MYHINMLIPATRFVVNSVKTLRTSHACRCKLTKNVYSSTSRFMSDSKTSNIVEKPEENDRSEQKDEHNPSSVFDSKYKVFHDEDSQVIFDVSEEKKRIDLGDLIEEQAEYDPFQGINLERGVNGVFELDDLIELLKKENAKQIFVATVPPELTYVDYIVVVTGKSPRHIQALATFVRKIFKLKKHKTDALPKIEGEKSKEWQALDLGNIALHIFSAEERVKYDLETLWSVGSQYDDLSNAKDDESDIMQRYNAFLKDFQPAE
ncbi:hypothetical protein TKK_0008465 [Trichogramma kaykai]